MSRSRTPGARAALRDAGPIAPRHPLARDRRLAALVHEQPARQGERLERPGGQRHRRGCEQHGERVLGELRQHFALEKLRQQRANQSLASVERGIHQPRPTAGRGQQAFLPGAGVFDPTKVLHQPGSRRARKLAASEDRCGGGCEARGDQQPGAVSRYPFRRAFDRALESLCRGIVEQAKASLGQARAQVLEQPGLSAAGCRAEPDDGARERSSRWRVARYGVRARRSLAREAAAGAMRVILDIDVRGAARKLRERQRKIAYKSAVTRSASSAATLVSRNRPAEPNKAIPRPPPSPERRRLDAATLAAADQIVAAPQPVEIDDDDAC